MKLNYDDFKAEKRELYKKVPLEVRNPKRGIRRRPRDPEERKVLFAMVRRRIQRAFETGELEYVGPRRMKLRLNKPQ